MPAPSPAEDAEPIPVAAEANSYRWPGISLAAFPAWLYAFIPHRLQTRIAPGTVTRRVLALALPSVAEQSLVTLIGLVDAYIVGHLGAAALAGVGLGGQVLNLTAALFGALGVGATALIARHIGAQEPEEANRLARQALLLALVIGLTTAVACTLLAAPIVALLGAAPEVVQTGSAWLRAVAPSFLALGVLLVGTACMRGAGDTRTPLAVMVVVNVINVSLALALTRGLLGLPRLGVVGNGIGTCVGQFAGGLTVLTLLARGRGPLRLGWSLPRPDLARLGRILNVGLPAGAEQVLLQVALLNLAAIISQLGTAAYAAHQVGIRISSISFLPGWGFSVAATTLVGQELGAGRPERARRATHVAFLMALAVMTVMGAVLYIFNASILRLFTDDLEVIRAGTLVIQVSALAQPVLAAAFVFSGALRGAGDTRTTMLITVASVWGLRLVCAYLLATVLGLGLLGIWLAFCMDFGFRALFFWLRFRGGRWAALRV